MVSSRLLAFAAVIVSALVVAVFSVRGSAPESARDIEECVEALGASPSFNQSSLPLSNERGGAADCNARFAGRRKPGGGYTYYDFMQGRNFDIAGPNPTVEERNWIDREYIDFLDVQRRQTERSALEHGPVFPVVEVGGGRGLPLLRRACWSPGMLHMHSLQPGGQTTKSSKSISLRNA